VSTALTFGPISPYTHNGLNRGGPNVPLIGGTADQGQTQTTSSVRRKMLRFGTPMVSADGNGAIGHHVTSVAVMHVQGPAGSRWVVGTIEFRTTETPPQEVRATPPARETTVTPGGLDRAGPNPGGTEPGVPWLNSSFCRKDENGNINCVSVAVIGRPRGSG
jgi:hypothetical protein